MLELYLKRPSTLNRFRGSPVGEYIDSFAGALYEMGYTRQTGAECLEFAVHLGLWAARTGISIESLDESAIAGFKAHLPICGYPFGKISKHSHAGKGARLFLSFLRGAGAGITTPAPESTAPDIRRCSCGAIVSFDGVSKTEVSAREAGLCCTEDVA